MIEIHPDVLSAFRPCGRDLVEFFNSTGWAFTSSWRAVPSPDDGRLRGSNLLEARLHGAALRRTLSRAGCQQQCWKRDEEDRVGS